MRDAETSEQELEVPLHVRNFASIGTCIRDGELRKSVIDGNRYTTLSLDKHRRTRMFAIVSVMN